jgi:hypothetical protein
LPHQTQLTAQEGFVDPKRLKINTTTLLLKSSSTVLWNKLEEVDLESWDDFSELFTRHVVFGKPVKKQTVKSE